MPLWIWICLAVWLVIVIPPCVLLIVAGVKLWKRICVIEESTGKPVESLLIAIEMMDARLERANERAGELEKRMQHLNEAMGNVALIRWALGDARSAFGFWRSLSGR